MHPPLPPLVLASGSPRRRELLSRIGLEFRVQVLEVDEDHTGHLDPRGLVLELAELKGRPVAELNPGSIVISADTIVVIDGDILGKPRDRAEAIQMLSRLAGCRHEVYTGYCLHWCSPASGEVLKHVDACITGVRFHPLSQKEIEAYVDSGEPMDKAGSYGIQELGALLVAGVEGCYFNVMGLPVSHLWRALLGFALECDRN